MLIDETSTNGLFNLSSSSAKGDVPIICVDEVFKLFANVLSASKNTSGSSTLNMDRLCKLYDGGYWYSRVGTASAKVALSCFTTPRRFLEEIWPKILNCKNGLADRILILYGQHDSISLDETAQFANNLDQSPIKNLNHYYERIYTRHHATDKEYTLSQLAKEAFTACTKRDQYKNEAKSSKNLSKIATVLHVLWHHIG